MTKEAYVREMIISLRSARLDEESGIEDDVQRWANCAEADVDENGDIWIEGPQAGHWLDDDAKERFLGWLASEALAPR